MKKAIFFDIDGTLWDFHNYIPDSTREAIRRLRENDCLTFLCSGRSRAFIQNPKLLSLGFDGIVSGCGTMIEYNGKTLLYKRIENELAAHTIETVRRFGLRPVLEGREYLYLDEEEFRGDRFGEKLRMELGNRLLPIAAHWGEWEISKLSCATDHADRDSCFAALKEHYDYIVHTSSVVEMIPKGCHKGTGVEKVCELLDLSLSDTYAFGDSTNDLGMFASAGTAIAMGSGSDDAKAAADYVTAGLTDDGIYKACRHFGLI